MHGHAMVVGSLSVSSACSVVHEGTIGVMDGQCIYVAISTLVFMEKEISTLVGLINQDKSQIFSYIFFHTFLGN